MKVAERAELNRQGAKAAARGEHARNNPLRRQVNRPRFTGEMPVKWLQRLRAWAEGYERQRHVSRPPVKRPLGVSLP